MITSQQIVRCIRRDYGVSAADLRAGVAYCEQISRNANYNGNSTDAAAYSGAATMLAQQAATLTQGPHEAKD